MSYIISNGQLIATTAETLKSGESVVYSSQTCVESINASREFNLVNQKSAKISNAKKWERDSWRVGNAKELNPGEYLI
jgi:hypothetical protein